MLARNFLTLKRKNTCSYNEYENHLIHLNDYKISIQCNERVNCTPKINIKNPFTYSSYEVFIFHKTEIVIPMFYKELFDKQGKGSFINKKQLNKLFKYIQSPFCIMMEVK